MCDTYIENIGFICWGCQEEFKKWLFDNELTPKTESEIRDELTKFMKTYKSDSSNKEMSVDQFFNWRSK